MSTLLFAFAQSVFGLPLTKAIGSFSLLISQREERKKRSEAEDEEEVEKKKKTQSRYFRATPHYYFLFSCSLFLFFFFILSTLPSSHITNGLSPRCLPPPWPCQGNHHTRVSMEHVSFVTITITTIASPTTLSSTTSATSISPSHSHLHHQIFTYSYPFQQSLQSRDFADDIFERPAIGIDLCTCFNIIARF